MSSTLAGCLYSANVGWTEMYCFCYEVTVSVPSQFAFNTLSRVSPVSHGVCNVVSACFLHPLAVSNSSYVPAVFKA